MRLRRLLIPLAFSALATSAASADVLTLDGTYGDKRGCEFQKTNDYSEDAMLSLTSEGYQTYVAGCEFVQAATAKNGDKVITATCGQEGEGETTIEFLRLRKVENADAYELFDAQGNSIGRADRCPK